MIIKYCIILVCIFFCFSCNENDKHVIVSENPKKNVINDTLTSLNLDLNDGISVSEIEANVLQFGLIDIKTIDTSIKVDLKYSSSDNFLGIDVYNDYNKCYLQKDVAEKLKKAQSFLKEKYPYYNIIVFDAVRPVHVQYKLWELIKVPEKMKSNYVSNPKKGSLHNYGAAVDVSVVDENGVELDMGTKFDFFGELAYPREEQRLLVLGKLSYKHILNREILRNAMTDAGFTPITSEWWHFNSCTLSEASKKYKIIE